MDILIPEAIPVKISSEGADLISLTPVVSQQMALRELIGLMLPLTGKDPVRIGSLLRRGSFVSGASRFRWSRFEMDVPGIEATLQNFPDSDPGRPFDPAQCTVAILRGPTAHVRLERDTAKKRRFLRRRVFWEVLLEAAERPQYLEYSYKENADSYRVVLQPESQACLRAEANLLPYSTLASEISSALIETAEYYCQRK